MIHQYIVTLYSATTDNATLNSAISKITTSNNATLNVATTTSTTLNSVILI